MLHKRTSRHCPCINVCSMWSPVRPSSITIPMCVWSNYWKTGNKGQAARGRRQTESNSSFFLIELSKSLVRLASVPLLSFRMPHIGFGGSHGHLMSSKLLLYYIL